MSKKLSQYILSLFLLIFSVSVCAEALSEAQCLTFLQEQAGTVVFVDDTRLEDIAWMAQGLDAKHMAKLAKQLCIKKQVTGTDVLELLAYIDTTLLSRMRHTVAMAFQEKLPIPVLRSLTSVHQAAQLMAEKNQELSVKLLTSLGVYGRLCSAAHNPYNVRSNFIYFSTVLPISLYWLTPMFLTQSPAWHEFNVHARPHFRELTKKHAKNLASNVYCFDTIWKGQ